MHVYHVHVFSYCATTRRAVFSRRVVFLRRAVFLRLSRKHRPALLLQLDAPYVRLHLFYLQTAGVCWDDTPLDHFEASTWPMSAHSVCALRSSTPHPKLGFNVEGIRRRLIETHGPPNTPPVSRGLYDGEPDAWAHHDLCLVREVAQSAQLDASQTSDDEDGAGSTDPWQNARKQMGVVTTLRLFG